MGFWQNVDIEREYQALSRKELSYRANFSLNCISTGIARNSVPSADVAYRIAKVLNVSIEYLLGEEDSGDKEAGTEFADRERKYRNYRSVIDELDMIPDNLRNPITEMIHALANSSFQSGAKTAPHNHSVSP